MNGKKKKKRVEAWNRDREDNDEWLIYTKTRSRVFRYCLHRRRGRGERCTVQIIFEEERKKKKKKRKKRILKSTNHCPIRYTIEMVTISHEYESTRSSSFLRKKKKEKDTCRRTVRFGRRGMWKGGNLLLVPSRIFSRLLKLKFYGGYDRNHWRVNRVELVLYDVTIATFYKASWGP